MILWGVSAIIGMLLAWIYSEPATMFPNAVGGISLYANEGWRKYTTFVGPLATFGYWIGWSVVLSIFGKIIGDLVESAVVLELDLDASEDGVVHLDAAATSSRSACIIGVWAFNVFGIRPMKGLAYVTGGLLMVALVVFMFVPYISGHWHRSQHSRDVHRPVGRLQARRSSTCSSSAGRRTGMRGVRHVRARVQDTEQDTHDGDAQLRRYSSSASFIARCRSAWAASRASRRPRPSEGQFYTSAFQTHRRATRRRRLPDLPDRRA